MTQWNPIETAPDHQWVMVRGGTFEHEEPAIRGWEDGPEQDDVSNSPKSCGWLTADCIRIVPKEWRELQEGE